MFDLLTTDHVVWTMPVNRKVRALIEKYEDTQDEAVLALIPAVEEYRITMRTVTVGQDGQRGRMIESAKIAFKEDYGVELNEFTVWFRNRFILQTAPELWMDLGKEIDEPYAREMFDIAMIMSDWSIFLVALHSVEKRTHPYLQDGEGAWEKIETPAYWRDYRQFVAKIPKPLFEAGVRLAHSVNPGLWVVDTGEEAKKFGGVSAST